MPIEQVIGTLVQELRIDIFPPAFQYAAGIAPIALLVLLIYIAWPLWVAYVRSKFIYGLDFSVLEIKLPKETFKSPLAMETFLNGIHNTADGNWIAQYWRGEFRPYCSLEIISVEGRIKFFIWCESRRKGGLMSALYSQFPRIEITEREDYAKTMAFDPKVYKVWAAEFVKTKDDPYPIKTYVDYGLDKDPKEEFKVDPMLAMLEFLGSVGPDAQVWIQMMVRAHKKDQRAHGHLIKRADYRKEQAKEIVNELLARDKDRMVSQPTVTIKGKPTFQSPSVSQFERDVATAIERANNKPAFDVGIRAIYIAKKEVFDTPFGIGGCISSFKNYNSDELNGFKPTRWISQFEYAWQDYNNIRRNRLSRQVIDAYKRRSYFYPPWQTKPFVLNGEELATIYHFPGSVAATPTLERVPSKRAEAPTNLPI